MAKRAKKKKPSSKGTPGTTARRGLWLPFLQTAVIVAAVFSIFWPALHGGFLSDDNLYFQGNFLLQEPGRLWKAWFVPGSFIEYCPIEQSVQWVQWQLWGTNTTGYHATNIVLHIVSSLLVWRLLGKFGLRWAWLGGLLFAVHPMAVESVAWISEFKNGLSLPPFLLAMCAWVDYEERRRPRDYLLALGWFLAAMLCKISMAPFPVMILIFAWWKRRRVGWGDLKASVPFFVISFILSITNILSADWYAVSNPRLADPIFLGGFLSRLACAGTTLSYYLAHCFAPVGMSPVYPLWSVDPPSLLQVIPWLVFGGLFYWLWRNREGWGRHVLLALLFFFLFLAPYSGFIAISYMSYTWVMDHFTYISLIAWTGIVVAGCEQLARRLSSSSRTVFLGALAVVLVVLAWGSRAYASIYESEETLWSYAQTQNPGSWWAHTNLGSAFLKEGRTAQAIEQFEEALRINPNSGAAMNNFGNALANEGRTAEAVGQYEQALRINPDFAEAHYNLGNALLTQGRPAQAMEQFEQAIRFNPSYLEAYNNLGNVLQGTGRAAEAIDHYEQALRIDPDFAPSHNGLGNALQNEGRTDEAIAQYEQALRINPNMAEAYVGMGTALQNEGRLGEAIAQYEQALNLNPNLAEAHNDLGCALQSEGRTAEALAHFEQALRINPNFAAAQSNLARLQAPQKKVPVKN